MDTGASSRVIPVGGATCGTAGGAKETIGEVIGTKAMEAAGIKAMETTGIKAMETTGIPNGKRREKIAEAGGKAGAIGQTTGEICRAKKEMMMMMMMHGTVECTFRPRITVPVSPVHLDRRIACPQKPWRMHIRPCFPLHHTVAQCRTQ